MPRKILRRIAAAVFGNRDDGAMIPYAVAVAERADLENCLVEAQADAERMRNWNRQKADRILILEHDIENLLAECAQLRTDNITCLAGGHPLRRIF